MCRDAAQVALEPGMRWPQIEADDSLSFGCLRMVDRVVCTIMVPVDREDIPSAVSPHHQHKLGCLARN